MRIIRFFFIIGLLLCAAAPCFAQAAFRISPPVHELTVGRGGSKVFSFELFNEDKENPLEFKIYPMDVEVDRGGNPSYFEPGSLPNSCSTWLTVEPKAVKIEAGKIKKIVGKLNVPGAASAGGYYGAVVCELVSKSPKKDQSGAQIIWRIATLLKVTVIGGRLTYQAEIENLSLVPLSDEERQDKKPDTNPRFVAAVKNTGNVHVKAQGKLIVFTPDKRRKGEVDFDMGTGTILPGHTRDFAAVFDKSIAEGDYIARATFRIVNARSMEKEIPFSIQAGSSQTAGNASVFATETLVLIPKTIEAKIPAGGFRTAGVSLRNQKQEDMRVVATVDTASGIADWFSLQPEALVIAGGREAKIVMRINVPAGTKPGAFETKINLYPSLVTMDGTEEKLDPVAVGVVVDVPLY